MVGHEDIGVDRALVLPRSLRQAIEVEAIFFFRKEARLPIVATLDDVLRDVGQIESWLTKHDPWSLLDESVSESAAINCGLTIGK